jgi:dolichol-phosphate mannosyltransferase
MRSPAAKLASENLRVDPPPWRARPLCVRIVLPAYNEAPSLGKLLENIDLAMWDAGQQYAIVLVDDGSSDETAEVAASYLRYLPIEIVRHPKNKGLGDTTRDGLMLATKQSADRDIIVVMDADNTHSPGLIRNMVRLVHEGSDVVIASRYQPRSRVRGVPWLRKFLSVGASLIFRLFFPIQGVKDYTCGYRAYRAGALKRAFEKYGDSFIDQSGFQCMVDILIKMRAMDLVFSETPLVLRYDFKEGASKMKVFKTIRNTLLLLVRRRLGDFSK